MMRSQGRARLGAFVLAVISLVMLGVPGTSLAAKKTIGVVMSSDLPQYKEAHTAFLKGLKEAGFGDNVEIFVQSPNPDPMSWANSVRKFVGVDVDIMVTYGAPATETALRETTSIPVVFAFVYDPESGGMRKANSTGISSKVPMITLLKTLKSISPCSKLAVPYSPSERDSKCQQDDIAKSAPGVGLQAVSLSCKGSADVMDALKKAGGVDCVYIPSSASVGKAAASMVSYANKNKMPTITQMPGLAENGAMLGLSPSAQEQGRVAAKKVASILKGGSPASEPVENSRQVELVLNLKTANALGMKVPFDLLNSATKVVK